MGDSILTTTDKLKYLGVIIDDKITKFRASFLRRAIALARHRAPNCCVRRVILARFDHKNL